MSKGPKKPVYRAPKKKGEHRDPRDPTRMVTNPGRPQAVSPSADDFDLDIDVSDPDPPELKEADPFSVTDVSDFFGDEDEPTLEVSAFHAQQAENQDQEATRTINLADERDDTEFELEAPAPPVDVQPLYRPSVGDEGGPTAEPVETLSTPDLSDRQLEEGKSGMGGLFDDLSEERSMPTMAVAPPPRVKKEPLPPPPIESPSSQPGRKHRFASGVTEGMQPLNIDRFDHRPVDDKSKRRSTPSHFTARGAEPLPMAQGQRIRKRGIGLQEILLILLVLMLGLASWVGYKIYKNQQAEKEAAALDDSREQFQQLKDDAIEKNKEKRESETP